MAKHGKAGAVPTLRFPEFRSERAWDVVTLSKACDMKAGKFVAASDIAATPMQNYFPCYGGNGLRGYTKSSTHEGKYSLIGRQGEWCGNVRLVSGRFHATEHAVVATPREGVNTDWLFHALVGLDLNKHATGQAQPGLSVSVLGRVALATPSAPLEQQKIADCLTSLDEVIAAQGRKVEALKAHKRGLMQQLFPRAGETRPRLRFPEFRNAPEWREAPLGQLVELLSGYPFDGKDIAEDATGRPLLRGINITEGYVRHSSSIDRYYLGPIDGLDKYHLEIGDLVIGMDGSKVGKNSALITEDDAGALLIQRVARLRARLPSSIGFIFQQINSPRFHAYVDRINTSSGIPHISAKQINEYPIHSTTTAEQQRIADCLASLDTRIRAETARLTALTTHKRGLMQQLFPQPEAAA